MPRDRNIPLAPTPRPPSSSWSRSATSCDVDMPVGATWWYLRCSSPCTWPGLKPMRSTAWTAGHWLHAGHSWLPPTSARQNEGCWAKGRQGLWPQGPRRGSSRPLWPISRATSSIQGALVPSRPLLCVQSCVPRDFVRGVTHGEDINLITEAD